MLPFLFFFENVPEFLEDNPQYFYRSIITNIDASISFVLENISEIEEDNPQDRCKLSTKEKHVSFQYIDRPSLIMNVSV